MIVGIGELLWDCFGETRQPGGAPANVAFHATQLGASGRVISRVGSDPDGDELLDVLTRHGLPTETIQRDPDHATGTVTVNAAQATQPVYTIHENVAWDYLEWDKPTAAVVAAAEAVCFGTLAQRADTSRATIQTALDANPDALRVYDVNLRRPWYSREVIEASLHRSDVVKLNEEEIKTLAELLDLGETGIDSVVGVLEQEFGVETVCVTRGAGGCIVRSREGHVELTGHEVKVVDTVGAGDAFTAAFVCGLLWKWPIADIARFANAVGGLVAQHRGAMPPLGRAMSQLHDRFAASADRG